MAGGKGDDYYKVDTTGDLVIESANGGTDTIELSNWNQPNGRYYTYILPSNVENLIIGSGGPITGIGNELSNTLTGSNDYDTLDGGAGADQLRGGLGNDIYLFNRGTGADTIVEDDVTANNRDGILCNYDIGHEQLWFTHTDNDLNVSIIGTTDKFTIKDGYLGSAHHVEEFACKGENVHLLDSQVESLVSAMAAFAPPAPGQLTLPSNLQAALSPVLAAAWLPYPMMTI